MKVRIKFRKYGVMKFIGHLDVMRFFQKAMRRAQIPIAYTEGYSPHMIMSFAQPLGVGITSDGEYLDIELTEPVSSREAVCRLNRVMVEGMDVVSFVEIPKDKKAGGMAIVAAADYRITLPEPAKLSGSGPGIPDKWEAGLDAFLSRPKITVKKKTKRSEQEVDIKPMIYVFEIRDGAFYMRLAAGSGQNLKPELVMDAYLRSMGDNPDEIPLRYHRLELCADAGEQGFIPLEQLGNTIPPCTQNQIRYMNAYPAEQINTVIFDIGNVLIDFAWRSYLTALGYEGEAFDRVADAMFLSEDWPAGDSGLVTTTEWLSLFIENDPAYETQIRKAFWNFGEAIQPFDYTEEWVQYFRGRGFRVFYLSNYSDEMYRQSWERLSFTESFDGGVFSWREKCMKPDPRIYHILMKRYDISPEKAIFFDDSQANVDAASALGIKGVTFTPDIALRMLGK